MQATLLTALLLVISAAVTNSRGWAADSWSAPQSQASLGGSTQVSHAPSSLLLPISTAFRGQFPAMSRSFEWPPCALSWRSAGGHAFRCRLGSKLCALLRCGKAQLGLSKTSLHKQADTCVDSKQESCFSC